jgi:hypothetical protein
MKFDTGVLHKGLSSGRKFNANQLSDNCTLPRSVNEFLTVLPIFLDLYW